jgi:hypothetical protein
MKFRQTLWAAGAALALAAGWLLAPADAQDRVAGAVSLSAGQKEILTQEPILVTAQLESPRGAVLPAGPGTTLRFDVQPAVKPRKGAKPLPLEAQGAELPATVRTYDLLEWFQFPAQGTWTVQAVVEHNGNTIKSSPLTVTISRPAKDDKEFGPVDRLHHMPWSNYTDNAFCGDCFDLVKRWPDSRLARYAHYWNGVYHQNKKEYDKAVESYRTAAAYPDFVLADHAAFGLVECLLAQKKVAEAAQHAEALERKMQVRLGKAGPATVQLLSRRLTAQLQSTGQTATGAAVRKD